MSRSRKIEAAVLSVLLCFAFAAARQSQSLKIVPDSSAAGVRSVGDTISVEWLQLTGAGSQTPLAAPVAGDVFYASAPAGGDLAKYTKLASALSANEEASFYGTVNKRVTRFVPNRQGGRMGPGIYFIIVASVIDGDTLYSDYLNLMIASSAPPELISPKADVMKGEFVKKLTDLAPVFTWKPVPGVPYYHIVLSDKPFINSAGAPDTGVNIIWQAITPGTRIAYGAPDPSGMFTASPPPLASGTTYSWMVLNNYGNRPAFTSWDVVSVLDGVAGRFLIVGDSLAAPNTVSPERGSVFQDAARIEFKWTGLDVNANSYLVNLLRVGATKEFGMGGMGDFNMGLLVWETTVPSGGKGLEDMLSVTLDAASTLTGGSYKWRVYALDNRGAAFTDSASSSDFIYKKSDEGVINIRTVERIGGVELPVGYVELKSEVLSGPAMTPLLFYTNGGGEFKRQFSSGTYRISAIKEGYPAYTATVTVGGGGTVDIVMPMTRSEAVLYGRALSASDSSAISAGRVTAVSEWGDTVSSTTDGGGNFVLACRAADWVLTAEKAGFRASIVRNLTLRQGDNRDIGNVCLVRNPFALSGTVRNSSGVPVMGAQVRILRDGVLVDEVASTSQSGMYAFYLTAGTYTVTAEKAGFAMFARSVTVAGTMAQDITLREGAVLVSGVITGSSWVAGENGGSGGYVYAPVTSARVTFADIGNAAAVFTVSGDAVFGKFSVSLPPGREYDVTVSASGFAAPAGGARRFRTGDGSDLSKSYTDTLFALAAVKGRISYEIGGSPADVDVIVYSRSGGIVASAKSVGSTYEVRNIPDGDVIVGAGAMGYYTRGIPITVKNGRLDPNSESYDFLMVAGEKTVNFDIEGYKGGGAVKVVLPLNQTLFFDDAPGTVAKLEGAGGGDYIVEAVPDEANSNRLDLSYHRFTVPDDVSYFSDTLYFKFTYAAKDTLDGGGVKIDWPVIVAGSPNSDMNDIKGIALFYRSEGNARFDSLGMAVNSGALPVFDVKSDRVRDGCKLDYYFRIYMENGDIYGSSKRLYHAFVKPNPKFVSRVAVEPGAVGGDTLVMPSLYKAVFTFRAFYGDQFVPISGSAGSVVWSIADSNGAPVISPGVTGVSYPYTTPDLEQDLTLRASFRPSGDYKMKAGIDSTVEFTVRVTGRRLKSISVLRKGDGGPIFNTDKVGFRVQAFDGDGKPVTVSPEWRIYPRGARDSAGTIDADGLFTPRYNFVGTAGIVAAAGGLTSEYTEPGAASPGQKVNYVLRRNAAGSDTADTRKGMRVIFGPGAVRQGVVANLGVTVPSLTNYVHRGTKDFMMADSVAFDLSYSDLGALDGDVVLAFDIPEKLREAAKDGGHEFRVARWFPDSSLQWIPIDSARTRIDGGVVFATLSLAPAEDEPVLSKAKAVRASAALSRRILGKIFDRNRASKALNRRNEPVSRPAELVAAARYALVVKTNKTSIALSVSPHPFSPYIVPVKEHGPGAKAGTCIKVNVQAPEPFVKSVKVRIHNATGKMVWGIEKLGAQTGESAFWWNGRTSGSGRSVGEDMWSEDYYERNAGRPLCRNGRYYVMVIVTDMDGKERRAMKPLVLMK